MDRRVLADVEDGEVKTDHGQNSPDSGQAAAGQQRSPVDFERSGHDG